MKAYDASAALSEDWHRLMAKIDDGIDDYGFWAGEAAVLRDAIGARRVGPRVSGRILDALQASGFECDSDRIFSESDPLLVRRAGAGRLIDVIARLLPDIREADRVVPANAMWRDEIVASRATRHWRPDDHVQPEQRRSHSDGPSDDD